MSSGRKIDSWRVKTGERNKKETHAHKKHTLAHARALSIHLSFFLSLYFVQRHSHTHTDTHPHIHTHSHTYAGTKIQTLRAQVLFYNLYGKRRSNERDINFRANLSDPALLCCFILLWRTLQPQGSAANWRRTNDYTNIWLGKIGDCKIVFGQLNFPVMESRGCRINYVNLSSYGSSWLMSATCRVYLTWFSYNITKHVWLILRMAHDLRAVIEVLVICPIEIPAWK